MTLFAHRSTARPAIRRPSISRVSACALALAILPLASPQAREDGPAQGSIPAFHWGAKAEQKIEAGGLENLTQAVAALRAASADQLEFQLSPSLFGREVEIPHSSAAPEFFADMISLNATRHNLAYFFAPHPTKTVWLFDRVRDTKRETRVPIRKAFWESYRAAFELSFHSNALDRILGYDKGSKQIIVRAPKPVAAVARQFAESMRDSANREVMIFPLRYANAGKTEFKVNEGERKITLQGVEDRLRKLFDFENNPADGARPSTVSDKPVLYTDRRLNNIVIVDHPENKADYKKVIDQLDRQPEMVEVTAAIIDLKVTSGLEWQSQFQVVARERPDSDERYVAGFGGGSFEVGADGLPAAALAGGAGLNAATVLVGSNYRIVSRVRALEREGNARILNQPSILAIDNHPARITDHTTAYTTQVGTRQVKTYSITAGLDLGIVPRVVEPEEPAEPGEDNTMDRPRQIHLLVDIGDGDVQADGDSTTDNRIVTQAVLRDGESLLIGGQFSNLQQDSSDHVPIVGKIPGIGLPFKNKDVDTNRFQRLYLITPKILKAGEAASQRDPVAEELLRASERDAAAAARRERPPRPGPPPKAEPTTGGRETSDEPERRRGPIRRLLHRKRS